MIDQDDTNYENDDVTKNSNDDEEESEHNDKKLESTERNDLSMIYDVPVNISAVIGCAKIKVNQLLKLGRGAIIELDKKVGDPVDIYVNDRIIAMGEIVIVDGNVGITMTEIIKINV